MRNAVKRMGLVAVAAVSGIALLSAGQSYGAGGEEVIKARVKFMKDEMDGHWKPLAAYAKSGKGTLADVEKNANALADLAKKIPEHFPKDTGRGNYPDTETRALAKIWTDWAGFEKDVQRLVSGSEKLASLAKEGNSDAVVSMIGKAGKYSKTKIGCAECHDSFRGKRVKK